MIKQTCRDFGQGLLKFLLVFVIIVAAFSAQALVITPSWDTTITSDPNAATIESTINSAIQLYEARFADPITVTILFKEISTSGLVGQSSWWYYSLSYSQFRSALQSDASTTNDTIALAHLPAGTTNPVTGTSLVRVKTANLKALGFTGMNSGLTNGVDGIIGLHISQINISRATNTAGKYDLIAAVEHEIDEVLGLASALDSSSTDPLPEDLFRYDSSGARTYTTNGDNAYFSIDGTTFPARFNQNHNGDFGDWWTAGTHTPQVQDAFETSGVQLNAKTELIALDVIGYNLLPVPIPRITSVTLAGTQLIVNGTNGMATGNYVVLTSTNAVIARNLWSPISTNMLSTNGNFTFTITNAVSGGLQKRFFTLEVQ